MIRHSEEFKQKAVRIALASGLPRARVAADLGVGKSTLGKWVADYRPAELTSAPHADLAKENERLREGTAMRFAFVDAWRHQWRVSTLCRSAGERARLSFLAGTRGQPAVPNG